MFKKIILTALTLCMVMPAIPAMAKVYVVASDATWPPFEMINKDKKVEGYSTDYINAVAKEAGIEVEVRNVAWDGIFASLGANTADIVASSVTITPQRQKQMAFTSPYFTNYQALVVSKDSPIKTLQDLKDKSVGGQIGTTGILFTYELNETQNLDIDVRTYDEVGLAMEDLKNGRIDAVMCDDRVASFYAENSENYEEHMQVALVTEEAEHFGFALRKNDTELLETLNKGIEAVKAKGIEEELRKKWFE